MGEKERFRLLESEKIDKNIYIYLKSLFEQLNVEILGNHIGNLFELMKNGKLEGWCWQTTESAALFMQDDTIVYRGNLYFEDYKTYYHSFIEFNYEGNRYVFDPCLSLINTADLYFKTFNVDIKGQVTAKDIKKYFINYINNPSKKVNYLGLYIDSVTDRFMREYFGDDYLKDNKNEIIMHDIEEPSAPMYRNGAGYKDINIDKEKIKSLTVHYYANV